MSYRRFANETHLSYRYPVVINISHDGPVFRNLIKQDLGFV
jgi:hypothetical protein